jgi:hypothetical protein
MSEHEWKWITPEEWYSTLGPEERAEADKRMAILSRYGASDPLSWVSSEMRENIPQVVRFLILQEIRRVMDRVPFAEGEGVEESLGSISKTLNIIEILEDGKSAFERLRDSGAHVEDLLRMGRAINTEAVLDMISILDEGYDPYSDDETMGWALAETVNFELTGRFINALHESILDVFEGDEQLQ